MLAGPMAALASRVPSRVSTATTTTTPRDNSMCRKRARAIRPMIGMSVILRVDAAIMVRAVFATREEDRMVGTGGGEEWK